MEKLPPDIIKHIISYFYNQVCEYPNIPKFSLSELGRMRSINKSFYKYLSDPDIWKIYYSTLFPYWKPSSKSSHKGPQTYANCGIGPYPGWNYIHRPFVHPHLKCEILEHYDNLVPVNKNVRWTKNLFKMCAKRTWTKIKNKFKWTKAKEQRLRELRMYKRNIEREIQKLEKYKEKTERVQNNFKIIINERKNKTSRKKIQ